MTSIHTHSSPLLPTRAHYSACGAEMQGRNSVQMGRNSRFPGRWDRQRGRRLDWKDAEGQATQTRDPAAVPLPRDEVPDSGLVSADDRGMPNTLTATSALAAGQYGPRTTTTYEVAASGLAGRGRSNMSVPRATDAAHQWSSVRGVRHRSACGGPRGSADWVGGRGLRRIWQHGGERGPA